ncbi:thiamine biosynthesis protein ApbE [Burkholderia diffusa]|uniref:FAD:protein FMN transferase n=1 Tax=Burkholderia diffusa TaxID=488732 RepID=UPI00075898BD|nr:FAD:protein FMN transferase [Burkholderia diffusa]KUZ16514.1 thiamine biosynthesis protein ApbE [Burkholderia diffusa]KVC23629.1 thiamine biosynthesis protein ApbE [Burkholderia diffusa]
MQSRSSSLRRARPLLGTIVEITAMGLPDSLSPAIDAAFTAVEEIHRLMSFHEAGSDVSRINAAIAGATIEVHPHTWRVLERAMELSTLSDGAFDVTTATLLVDHGFLPRYAEHDVATRRNTYRDLELIRPRSVKWRQKALIDLGGIAKGYAVDCAIDALRAAGTAGGIVNAGGDLRCFGARQPIHVRHPAKPTELISLGWLANGAIATSSGYFAGTIEEGRRIDPLVDARNKTCIAWDASVSVIANDCTTADAATKIVRLAGEAMPGTLAMLDAQAILIDGGRIAIHGTDRLQWRNDE